MPRPDDLVPGTGILRGTDHVAPTGWQPWHVHSPPLQDINLRGADKKVQEVHMDRQALIYISC